MLKTHQASRHRVPFRLTGRFEQLEPRELLAFDPSPIEQAFMEDVNRMRQNPLGELSVLFSSLNPLVARDPDVQGAVNYFRVDTLALQQQWSELVATSPVAWNEDLYDAAAKHNLQMQLHDEQGHQVGNELALGPRVSAEGYQFRKLNENVYAFAESHIHGHAGFVVDWGDGPGGIQSPAGHRIAMMDPDVVEVGIAVLQDTNPQTQVGPYLVTQDFGQPRTAGNPFLMGVAWEDYNSNGIYDPGEGLGGATIQVTGTGGTFTTTSMSAGGYQVRVPDGTYQVSVMGGMFGTARVVPAVAVNGKNVKVDFKPSTGSFALLANPDSLAMDEDTVGSINVLSNDRYSNGALVNGTTEITGNPAHGSILQNLNGTIRYQPNANFSGTDSFRYRVRDNTLLVSNEATVTVTVNGVNDSPIANSFMVTTPEDTAISIPLLAQVSDTDNAIDWSQLRIIAPPARGVANVDVANRSIVFTPAENFNGLVSIQYQVADVVGAVSSTGNISVDVSPVNDPPRAVDDVFAMISGTLRTLNVKQNDSDPDGDLGAAAVMIDRNASHGQATLSGGLVQYVPQAGFVGQDLIEYSLRDQAGSRSATARITVLVTRPETPWHNPVNPLDVNGDGVVALNDAILVINQIGKPLLAPSDNFPPPLFDVIDDNVVVARDVLQIINFVALNNGGGQASASLTVWADDQDEFSPAAIGVALTRPLSDPVAVDRSEEWWPLAPLTRVIENGHTSARGRTERLTERLVDQLFAEDAPTMDSASSLRSA